MYLVSAAPQLAVPRPAVGGSATNESWGLSHLFCDPSAGAAPEETLRRRWRLFLAWPPARLSAVAPSLVPQRLLSLLPGTGEPSRRRRPLVPSARPGVLALCLITHTRAGRPVAYPAVLQKKAPLAIYVRLSRGGSLRQRTLGVERWCGFAAAACWPWPLPLPDRPLRHDGMPHRAHFERQVSHYGRQRTQALPRSLRKEKRRPPPAGPAEQLWPATLAGPSHEA